jgi:serine/threonine protein kinase
MGEVYKARDTRLDRTVAIKILPDNLASDPQFRDRFYREARSISQLDHPHICALYDVGQQNGTAYLVMQDLEGETLADRLMKGALPLDQALQVAIQIADALATAHKAGVVHRDLKPGNIMLTKAGAKLLDFGLAKTGTSVLGGPTCQCCRRRHRSRSRGPSSARSSTWRPSSSKVKKLTRGRIGEPSWAVERRYRQPWAGPA